MPVDSKAIAVTIVFTLCPVRFLVDTGGLTFIFHIFKLFVLAADPLTKKPGFVGSKARE